MTFVATLNDIVIELAHHYPTFISLPKLGSYEPWVVFHCEAGEMKKTWPIQKKKGSFPRVGRTEEEVIPRHGRVCHLLARCGSKRVCAGLSTNDIHKIFGMDFYPYMLFISSDH